MDQKIIIEWLGIWGVFILLIGSVVKWAWPDLRGSMEKRTEIKEKELELKKIDQEQTQQIIATSKEMNLLMDKNNEIFNTQTTALMIYMDLFQQFREEQNAMKTSICARFDTLEDKIVDHDKAAGILSAEINNLFRLIGEKKVN